MIRSQDGSARVGALLRENIEDGTLRRGERLPSHCELAALLGVEREAIREALARLHAVGLLRVGGDAAWVSDRWGPSP